MIEKDKKYKVAKDFVGLCAKGTPIIPALDKDTHEIVIGKTGKVMFNLPVGSLFFSENEVEVA